MRTERRSGADFDKIRQEFQASHNHEAESPGEVEDPGGLSLFALRERLALGSAEGELPVFSSGFKQFAGADFDNRIGSARRG